MNAPAILAEPDTLPTADQAPPRSPVDDLVPGSLPPEGFDPLGDGILMQHQKDWVADHSPLKLCRKGRRTGITFAESLDSTIIAAAAKGQGVPSDSTFYIGDTKEKGLEFIGVCARFAQSVAKELLAVEEFLFEDVQPDGSTKHIGAYRIRFASGNKIVALSSNPANIRGLQGRVVIDEAAFHRNVAAVIDACNALLIWGGVIRIISTHNGNLNAFNELIRGIEAGDFDYSMHTVTFDDAVRNGLFERVCLINGETPTAEAKKAWYRKVRRSYGSRVDAMREELDVIPREGDGVMLPLAWIEACSTTDYKVLRWEPSQPNFVSWSEGARRGEMAKWLVDNVLPILRQFHNQALTWYLGEDFAMRQDRTALVLGYVGQDLKRHVPLIVELRTCPYDQQKQALFWLVDMLELIGGFGAGILDANGNGMVLAQECGQKYGQRIVEKMPDPKWNRETGPRFRAAFEDTGILIPADIDVRNDLRQLVIAGGVAKMPTHVRNDGTDGGKRHGDAAVALWNFHAATKLGNAAPWRPMNPAGKAPGSDLEKGWIPA